MLILWLPSCTSICIIKRNHFRKLLLFRPTTLNVVSLSLSLSLPQVDFWTENHPLYTRDVLTNYHHSIRKKVNRYLCVNLIIRDLFIFSIWGDHVMELLKVFFHKIIRVINILKFYWLVNHLKLHRCNINVNFFFELKIRNCTIPSRREKKSKVRRRKSDQLYIIMFFLSSFSIFTSSCNNLQCEYI